MLRPAPVITASKLTVLGAPELPTTAVSPLTGSTPPAHEPVELHGAPLAPVKVRGASYAWPKAQAARARPNPRQIARCSGRRRNWAEAEWFMVVCPVGRGWRHRAAAVLCS